MIVLDTHTLIWWVNNTTTSLSAAAKEAISAELAGGEIIISSISAWEIAMLVKYKRLALSMDVTTWLSTIEQIGAVRFVAVDNEISIQSVELPGEFHKDPADRLIVATARRLAAPLVTADEKILAYSHVNTIW